ncbi:hypothetical protein ATK86_0073 [Nocardia fluminea]|uniref:DUF2550 family protein n=2 Tax=Nocardia fluminea TaxID=134984 RepID=A0A2N3WW17_9NOCA|nr:hypothetical protein ATK86_0073 [Nocardia fluminea]
MTAGWIVFMVIVIVAVVLAVVMIIARIALRAVRRTAETAIAANFAPGEAVRSDPVANYFGLASKGGRQMRGNGALVLTDTRLWFHRAGADDPLEIPLASITSVDIVSSHAGKSIGRPLLSVRFGDDSAGWYVRDSAQWRDDILVRCPTVSDK